MVNDTDLAKLLLSIGAININVKNPFTYASGIKSPIYCDNRLLISYPKRRNLVRDAFINSIIDVNDVDCVAGTATAGIPHAAWIAEALQKPMIYVRGKAKGHGKGNMIEGLLEPGQKVLLIEDLISTGGSVFSAANAIHEAEGEVAQVMAIFSYNFANAMKAIKEYPVPVTTLCDFDVLLAVALEQKLITPEDEIVLRKWQQDPASF